MKKIGKFFKYIYNQTHKGFYFLCLVFSRGFYFYFYAVAFLFKLIFRKSKKLDNLLEHYKARQERPEYFFVLLFSCVLLIATLFSTVYQPDSVASVYLITLVDSTTLDSGNSILLIAKSIDAST